MAPPQVELGGMMWQKIWTDSDWTIIICTLLLVGIGLTAIGSATHVNQEAIGFGSLVVKQLVFFLANVAVVIGMQFIDYHRLKGWGNIILWYYPTYVNSRYGGWYLCTRGAALDSIGAYYDSAIRIF